MTHALARAGAFTWSEWSGTFVTALADDHASGGPTDGSTYYETWLSALEGFLVERELADDAALAELRRAWTDAYLATPHGSPVELDRGGG